MFTRWQYFFNYLASTVLRFFCKFCRIIYAERRIANCFVLKMPKKNRRSGVIDDIVVETPTVPGVTMSNEQFQMLLQSLKVDNTDSFNSSNVILSNSGNFARCSARFGGRENEDVELFIDTIITYQNCENVREDNALRGLPLLLEGTAAQWWAGIKSSTETWQDAITALRDSFSRKLPPPEVFRQIFANEQTLGEHTELFVCKIRALLAQLPYSLPDPAQIDIVYGLLHRRIKKRIMRDDVKSFNELLTRARAIEVSLRQSQTSCTLISDNPIVKGDSSTKVSRQRCVYCKNFGHLRDTCEKLFAKEQKREVASGNESKSAEKQSAVKSLIKCFGCGAPGVYKRNCVNCRSTNTQNTDTSSQLLYQVSNFSICPRPRPVLSIKVNGMLVSGIADTGAQLSIAGSELYRMLKSENWDFRSSVLNFSYADGVPREVPVLEADVKVTVGSRTLSVTFVILPECETNSTLLSADFLASAGIVLNLVDNCWFFADDPAHSHSFLPDTNNQLTAQLLQIPLSGLREDEGARLSPTQKSSLDLLLSRNSDIFGKGGVVPEHFATHHIRTQGNEPKSTPPYMLNGQKKNFLKKEIDSLLTEGIIEQCDSAWASPAILVPKAGGSFRLCIDYRKLNSVTVADSYPMPRIDDILQNAKGTAFMSTIDLQSGFHQVPLAKEDKDKSCFTTPFGTFRFTRMPFGLKNAPATFVRLMDRFKSGLGDRAIFVYLDDILILSNSFEEHIDDLAAVFNRLRLFNLHARREKCVFLRDSVKYLGHTISPSGIVPDADKVAAFSQMKLPTSTRQVASFVQTASWYRKFIPGFSNIARPLTNLLKKSAKFRFGDAEAEAFNTLKQKLTSAPVLRQPDFAQPFVLRTDASDYALGAVLLQGQENEERPIEYASRLLTPAERNYSTVEKEALAVVWSTDKFRSYLDGSQVIVSSDCQALQWLFALKTPSGRLARWALRLQGLNMKVTYTPGKQNVVADCLSRPFCHHSENQICAVCTVTVNLPSLGYTNFRQEQLSDPECKKIVDALESSDECDTKRWMERGFSLINGVLYHHDDDSDLEDPQLVVPSHCRERVMKQFHDSPTSGHCGVDRTFRVIADRFYFPGMRKFIKEYVQNCLSCQRYKVLNQKPAGFLQTPAPAQRFETLAVDLFGPLPPSKNGNRWVLAVEDMATKWMELFPMVTASADSVAKILIEEVFLRYGTCRRLISDNGVQFVSDIMQKVMFCFDIDTPFVPLYHAASNPIERKNRDLKTMLSILVQKDHSRWDECIASIRFAMNSTYTAATGHSPAFLQFGRELRTPHDSLYDFRRVVEADNFVPRITPYLRRLTGILRDSKDHVIREQDRRKAEADKHRAPHNLQEGDSVLLRSHVLSNLSKGISSKLTPRRDGPYILTKKVSPTAFQVCTPTGESVGKYHVSDLVRCCLPKNNSSHPTPVYPKRQRGRPRKATPAIGGDTPSALPGTTVVTSEPPSLHRDFADASGPLQQRLRRGRPRKHPVSSAQLY